jgi:protein TonB
VFFSFKNIVFDTKTEEIVCMKLCNVVCEEKIEPKLVPEVPHAKAEITPKAKEIQKKIVPREIKKIIHTIKTVPVVQEIQKEATVDKNITIASLETADATSQQEIAAESKETKSKITQEEYMDTHLQEIVRLLQENLYYPNSARKRGVVGDVLVQFSITMNAEVESLEVLSSKSELLSNAAMQTIQNLSGKFPKPKEKLILKLPIHYSLKQ